MGTEARYLPLVDLAPLYVALDTPQGGGLWRIVAMTRREETGSASCQVAVISGKSTDILVFRGPTVVGLGDTQLELECARLRRVREEADVALKNIEAHLAYRKSL